LKEKVDGDIRITITDAYGEKICDLDGKNNAGLNCVTWDLRKPPTDEERREQSRFSRFRRPQGTLVSPGNYLVILEIGDNTLKKRFEILPLPDLD